MNEGYQQQDRGEERRGQWKMLMLMKMMMQRSRVEQRPGVERREGLFRRVALRRRKKTPTLVFLARMFSNTVMQS
jgi:hypothetical protein